MSRREHDAGMRREQIQHVEFVRRQIDRPPIALHLAARGIDAQRSGGDHLGLAPIARALLARGRRSSARTRATSSRTPNGFVR